MWARNTVLTIATGLLLLLYWSYNPATYSFFPKCPFLSVTGFQCPGCGSQRALHCLLHFDFITALHYNPLLVVMLPYLIIGFFAPISSKYQSLLYGKSARLLVGFIIVSFWVFRNIF